VKAGWVELTFDEACSDVSSLSGKLLASRWHDRGSLPVIDQGVGAIAGYTDEAELAFRGDLPVVVFGDHTCRVKFVDRRFVVGADGVKLLKPAPGLDARYLYWFLATRLLPSAGYSRHFKFLKRLRVPVPPLPEQQRIAGILDAAERVRSARRRTLEALDQLRAAMLSSLLRMQDLPTESFGGLLGGPLGNGLSPATAGAHPGCVLTLSALSRGGFDERARKECLFDRPPAPRQMVDRGTFLVSRGNGNLSLVGAGAVVPADLPGVAFPDTMIGAKLDNTKVSADYLGAVWQSPAIREQIERVATTTNGTFKINQTKLAAIEVPLPSMTAQKEFAAKATRIAAQRRRAEEHLSRLDALFSSLQHRAFTGAL
jgi:type I restriction enzyme S subunit